MSWCELAARARGLSSRIASDEALAAIDRATEAGALARALADAGYAPDAQADAVDRATGATAARELALLSRRDPGAVAAIELDEDRRTLRAVLRGLAAVAPVETRLDGAVATASLTPAALARVAAAASPTALAAELARRGHPFAPALAAAVAPSGAVDILGGELALARAFATAARAACGRTAMRVHIAQVIDAENVTTALLIAARGGELDATAAFLDGGARVGRAVFAAACADPRSRRLAGALAGTPLAEALVAARPAALEDAALAWHVATQARLRRLEPEGPATVLHHWLRRRVVSRRVRRAAWRLALLGGPP